jgi:glycosyltransferase involved in cell wall biosynthesis
MTTAGIGAQYSPGEYEPPVEATIKHDLRRPDGNGKLMAGSTFHINHVLSSGLVTSTIFDHLIGRAAAAAPPGVLVTKSQRPDRHARVWHYHRANLEWRLRPRSVVTVHHDLTDDRQWLGLKYFLPRYREAAVIHVLNTSQQAMLARHGVSHVQVIPHGVDRRVFPIPQRPRQASGDRLRLGIFSRRYVSGIKGEYLFEPLLAGLDPRRVSFVLVGEERGHEAELARARGFTANHWERLPYRLMSEVYARTDALLILSQFEGGPACLPEALGSGVPVFCTPVGMCPDFVRDGANGIFLTGRPAQDGARIMALLDDHGRGMAALNDGAFAAAGAIASWEDVMTSWHALYRNAAAS